MITPLPPLGQSIFLSTMLNPLNEFHYPLSESQYLKKLIIIVTRRE